MSTAARHTLQAASKIQKTKCLTDNCYLVTGYLLPFRGGG